MWTGMPIKNGLDVHLCLIEGLKPCIEKQGRVEAAALLERRAMVDRSISGFPHVDHVGTTEHGTT